jgi:uncharacterized membrane protein YphA (DoxX/SURF4 family)
VRAGWKEVLLQLLFSAFPGGITGVSLLVLRAVLGVALLVEGGFYIREPHASVAAWCLGISAIASGGMLVVGFLTPFAGMLVGVGTVAIVLSLLPACTPNVFDSKPAVIFALTMLLAVVGAGPGRYSVDARMFGRREIIIPPREFQSEQ